MHGHETTSAEKGSNFSPTTSSSASVKWEIRRQLRLRFGAIGFVIGWISLYPSGVDAQLSSATGQAARYRFLKRDALDPKRKSSAPAVTDEPTGDEYEPDLLCASCGNPITTTGFAIPVEGSHRHHRVNPGGYEHHFRCFSSAFGIIPSGQLVYYFSWFSGFGWQMAHCSSCSVHMGWYFVGNSSFYGLLVGSLVEAPSGPQQSV